MATRLQESDMVMPGCVHSHEISEKTHPLFVSQARQAKLGMTKRVRDGSILINNDFVRNTLLNDLVIDFDDELGIDSTARDSRQLNFPDCFTHAMVNVRGCEIPRHVLQADTIVVNCGLANFEQSSWSTHRRHEFR